jgi:putative transposase
MFIFAIKKAMQTYKSGSHTRYDIKYHIVWISKYRKPIMIGPVAERLRELIRQICMQNEVTIIKGHVSKDHIHLLVSCSPSLAVSKLVQKLKGASSHKLFEEFAHLRKQYWGQHLWSRGYFVATTGTITDDMIREYIEHQDSETPDDDFRISS